MPSRRPRKHHQPKSRVGSPSTSRPVTEELLSLRAVAREYVVSVATLRRWIRLGLVAHVRVGPERLRCRPIRISRAEAERHLTQVAAAV